MFCWMVEKLLSGEVGLWAAEGPTCVRRQPERALPSSASPAAPNLAYYHYNDQSIDTTKYKRTKRAATSKLSQKFSFMDVEVNACDH